MYYRKLLIILITVQLVLASTSIRTFNVIPARFIKARYDSNINNWIGFNDNLFEHLSKLHSPTTAHIFKIVRDRNCNMKTKLICIACHEFRDFINQCPKIHLHKTLEIEIIHQDCSLKLKTVSLPIHNYNCKEFGLAGFIYTYS